jgi:hypothetical protein
MKLLLLRLHHAILHLVDHILSVKWLVVDQLALV